MKKYQFTGDTINFEGTILRRIRYLVDIYPHVKKGDLGGWIESEDNLSHDGNCRVMNDAMVFGNARIVDDAVVSVLAIVKNNALMKDNAKATINAIVGADTVVVGMSKIAGNSKVFFYDTFQKETEKNFEKNRMPNLDTTRLYGDTVIEATGIIKNCILKSVELFGHVTIKDKREGFVK